jgi:hypothetical protein
MVSTREMASGLAALLAREHGCMADFLEALGAFHRRRAWEDLGHASLFAFLTRELGLSRAAAYSRLVASDLAARFPEVLAALRDGRLCLSSVGEVAKVLTRSNLPETLPRFFHLSRREAAELAASIRPATSIPTRVAITAAPCSAPSLPVERAEPVGPAEQAKPTEQGAQAPQARRAGGRDTEVAVRPAELLDQGHADRLAVEGAVPRSAQTAQPQVVPLDADLRRLHLTVSRRLLAKLEAARDALSHSHPGASLDMVLEVGLDLVLERHRERRGIGATARANAEARASGAARAKAVGARLRAAAPGRITAEVKRRVWERDGGRCQWPLDGGGTCGSTLRLEFDHRVPKGTGGDSGESNVRLLCRIHNQRAARLVYGDAPMDRFARDPPVAREPCAAGPFPWAALHDPGRNLGSCDDQDRQRKQALERRSRARRRGPARRGAGDGVHQQHRHAGERHPGTDLYMVFYGGANQRGLALSFLDTVAYRAGQPAQPRVRAIWIQGGVKHSSGWQYPMYRLTNESERWGDRADDEDPTGHGSPLDSLDATAMDDTTAPPTPTGSRTTRTTDASGQAFFSAWRAPAPGGPCFSSLIAVPGGHTFRKACPPMDPPPETVLLDHDAP